MSADQPTGPSSPPAVRLRRPGWRDTRFLVGLVLVALSVAMGSAAFSAAARTVPVFVAAEPLVPGEAVDVGAVVVRQVRLAESLDRYLRADVALRYRSRLSARRTCRTATAPTSTAAPGTSGSAATNTGTVRAAAEKAAEPIATDSATRTSPTRKRVSRHPGRRNRTAGGLDGPVG